MKALEKSTFSQKRTSSKPLHPLIRDRLTKIYPLMYTCKPEPMAHVGKIEDK